MASTIELVKKSVTLPKNDVLRAQERVGKGGFSAYLAEALALQLRRDAMAETLARMEAKNGPTDQAEVARLAEWLAE